MRSVITRRWACNGSPAGDRVDDVTAAGIVPPSSGGMRISVPPAKSGVATALSS